MEPYRFHFTDTTLAQMDALGLDRDAVQTAVHQGSKQQLGENHLQCRHKGLEVEVVVRGPDYHVAAVRADDEWPRRPARLDYLQRPTIEK